MFGKFTLTFVASAVIWLGGCEPDNDKANNSKIDTVAIVCEDCPSLNKFTQILDRSNLEASWIEEVKTYMNKSRIPKASLPIEFSVRDFCNDPASQEFNQLQESYIAQFEQIAAARQSCTADCTININSAEYCAFDALLTRQDKEWPQISLALQNADILLQGADQSQRSIVAQVNMTMNGAAMAAQSGLTDNFEILLGNKTTKSDDVELSLAVKELFELGTALQAMYWAKLGNKQVGDAGNRLVALSSKIETIGAETQLALNRAEVLAPLRRQQLAKRNIDAVLELQSIKNILLSAKNSAPLLRPDTSANANNPAAGNSVIMQAAAKCFAKLSLNTAIAHEFGQVIQSELQSCRSFAPCQAAAAGDSKNLSNIIEHNLNSKAKTEKLMLSVRKAICT